MKKICVAVFTLMLGAALALNAGQPAKSPKAPYLKNYDKGTTLIFTNLQGPNHHKYNPGSGYYVDSSPSTARLSLKASYPAPTWALPTLTCRWACTRLTAALVKARECA